MKFKFHEQSVENSLSLMLYIHMHRDGQLREAVEYFIHIFTVKWQNDFLQFLIYVWTNGNSKFIDTQSYHVYT